MSRNHFRRYGLRADSNGALPLVLFFRDMQGCYPRTDGGLHRTDDAERPDYVSKEEPGFRQEGSSGAGMYR